MVTATSLEPATLRRLMAFGVAPGARIMRAQRTAHGGSVVAIGADRVALDAHPSRLIEVEPA